MFGRVVNSQFSKYAGLAATGATLADVVNLDSLMRDTIKLAPGTSADGVRKIAEAAGRALGLGGDDILMPVYGHRHAKAGQPITPTHFVVDLNKGRAWFTGTFPGRSKRPRGRPYYQRRWRGQSGAPSVQINKG